jgi:ethanolamine utilization protein EutN
MVIAKVVGNVWSTKKNEKINSLRLLFVQPFGAGLKPMPDLIVAADEIGAGIGEEVLITQGAPAMQALSRDELMPVDAVVVAIVDSLEMPDAGTSE